MNKEYNIPPIQLAELNPRHEQDAEFIINTVKEHYPKSPWPLNKETLAHAPEIYFKAINQNSQIIGMTGISPKTPYLAETVKTIIFDQFRGLGLGKVLSQLIENECAKRGFKKIMSSIYTFNLPMINIKLKQGYVIEGHHLDHEKPGLHEYTLGKFIK